MIYCTYPRVELEPLSHSYITVIPTSGAVNGTAAAKREGKGKELPVPVLTVASSTGQTTVVANSTHAGEDGTVISGIEISFSIHHTV